MTEASSRMPFAGNPLDRAAERRGDTAWVAARLADPASRFLPLYRTRPLVATAEDALVWLAAEQLAAVTAAPPVLLGVDGAGRAHFAVDLSAGPDPSEGALAGLGRFDDLRSFMAELPGADAAMAAQAKAMVDWHGRHRFCANCGAPSAPRQAGWSRHCEACGADHFPRTDPVVIMLATRGDFCLLGRQARFPFRFFSALAGFVEPGETIEEAVRREIKEEAGIVVGRVAYHACQPWPFPSSLMIGCFAEALSEAIVIDPNELEQARWASRAKVGLALAGDPAAGFTLPPAVAIAYHLARAWIDGAAP